MGILDFGFWILDSWPRNRRLAEKPSSMCLVRYPQVFGRESSNSHQSKIQNPKSKIKRHG